MMVFNSFLNYLTPKSLTVVSLITSILRVSAPKSKVVCLPTPDAPTSSTFGFTIPERAFSAEAILEIASSR